MLHRTRRFQIILILTASAVLTTACIAQNSYALSNPALGAAVGNMEIAEGPESTPTSSPLLTIASSSTTSSPSTPTVAASTTPAQALAATTYHTPTDTPVPILTSEYEPTPIPDLATYDVQQKFTISNKGPSTADQLRLTVAKIHSLGHFQKVLSFEIEPLLDYQEKSDELGNQFMEFTFNNIPSGGVKQFTVKYEVTVYRQQADLRECQGEMISTFIQPEKYIESDAGPIAALSRDLSSGTENVCQQVRAFYDFIGEYIEFTPGCDREDYGALKTLEYQSGDCTEYADLLIALSRSAGIPARFVEGLVPLPGNEKHDWAQVYLPGSGWVTIEPTWGRHQGMEDLYFAGATPTHIILTIGRNLSALNYKHYWTSRYWWNENFSQPLVKIKADWEVTQQE